jgi:hypothetical protein
MTEKREATPKFSNIKIDEEETRVFYQGKSEVGSNPIKIGFSETGQKVLLKTNIVFKGDNEKNKDANLSLDNLKKYIEELQSEGYQIDYETDLRQQIEALFAEEQAHRLCKQLGIYTPDSQLVFIDDVPYIAYEFIEEARDISFGINIELSKDRDEMRNQQIAIAKGALIKTLLSGYDDGQFLQIRKNGDIIITDLAIRNPTRTQSQEKFDKTLGYFFIQKHIEILAHQFSGINSEEIMMILEKLQKLSLQSILDIITYEVGNPTELEILKAQAIIDRIPYVVDLFTKIRENPEETFTKIQKLQEK